MWAGVFQSWIVVVFQQDCYRWFVLSIVIRSRDIIKLCTTLLRAESFHDWRIQPATYIWSAPRFPRKISIILHYSVHRHIFDSDVMLVCWMNGKMCYTAARKGSSPSVEYASTFIRLAFWIQTWGQKEQVDVKTLSFHFNFVDLSAHPIPGRGEIRIP